MSLEADEESDGLVCELPHPLRVQEEHVLVALHHPDSAENSLRGSWAAALSERPYRQNSRCVSRWCYPRAGRASQGEMLTSPGGVAMTARK